MDDARRRMVTFAKHRNSGEVQGAAVNGAVAPIIVDDRRTSCGHRGQPRVSRDHVFSPSDSTTRSSRNVWTSICPKIWAQTSAGHAHAYPKLRVPEFNNGKNMKPCPVRSAPEWHAYNVNYSSQEMDCMRQMHTKWGLN